MIRRLVWVLFLCGWAWPTFGQGDDKLARAEIDQVVNSLYSVISGPAGQARDSVRFYGLFADDARLCAIRVDSSGNRSRVLRSVPQFFAGLSRYTAKSGFFEQELARKTEVWDGMAHVWSSYQSFHNAEDTVPFDRGINSIQLYFDGEKWKVHSIFWQSETPQSKLPKAYLKGIK